MKKTRFTKAQIVSILKEVGAGMKVTGISRKNGITDAGQGKLTIIRIFNS